MKSRVFLIIVFTSITVGIFAQTKTVNKAPTNTNIQTISATVFRHSFDWSKSYWKIGGTNPFFGIYAPDAIITGNISQPEKTYLTVRPNFGLTCDNGAPNILAHGNIRSYGYIKSYKQVIGTKFVDKNNSNYYIDPSNSNKSIVVLGKVAIGTTNPKSSKLGVNGTITALEVIVANYNNWPDFVFADEYRLPKLSEVEAFIKENNHLPNVPSALEVEEKGVKLGEMSKILLQKVEELTLYVIELKKENESIQLQLKELKK